MFAVYLFNLAGYPVMFHILMNNANKTLVAQLDENKYDESALLEMKIPFHMPYMTNNNSYERYDGEVEANGVKYTYVKRKFSGDTLYMLYLPDQQGTRLLTAKTEYGKQVADLPAGKKEKDSSVKKGGTSPEYRNKEILISFSAMTISAPLHNAYLITALPLSLATKQERPPDTRTYNIV